MTLSRHCCALVSKGVAVLYNNAILPRPSAQHEEPVQSSSDRGPSWSPPNQLRVLMDVQAATGGQTWLRASAVLCLLVCAKPPLHFPCS